jgi:glycosyltransferase involved in cell wall biosynthesis
LNILYVVPNVPSAVRVRPFYFIQYLVARGHTVDCICLSIGEEGEVSSNLSIVCRKVLFVKLRKWRAIGRCIKAVVHGGPLRAAYFSEGRLSMAVAKAVATSSYDLVHFEHLKSHVASSVVNGKRQPVILDMVDCVSLFLREQIRQRNWVIRAMLRQELQRTELVERRCLERFHCLVTGTSDREALLSVLPSAKVTSIPNGVRLGPIPVPQPIKSIVFWGKLDYAPNADAATWICRALAPALRKILPELSIRIAGANGSTFQRRQALQAGVEFVGYFPSLEQLVAGSDLAIAPIRFGAGVQNKVLEAMAQGVPLVATEFAVRGLGAVEGQHFLQANSALDFVRCIRNLVNNGDLRASMVASAYRFVHERYSWDGVTDRLEQVYGGVIRDVDCQTRTERTSQVDLN